MTASSFIISHKTHTHTHIHRERYCADANIIYCDRFGVIVTQYNKKSKQIVIETNEHE